MKKIIKRSPFFYVGDKYKLMPQLIRFFPKDIKTYIEPFAGGGSSFLNVEAEKYIINDIDYYVIALHQKISSYANKEKSLFKALFDKIKHYGLSCSFNNVCVPDSLKKQYIKTYYAHYNKDAYIKMKKDFNENNDFLLLYLLLIYGFNHMIRFNSNGAFNLPVGNVDFNKNVYAALCNYLCFFSKKNTKFYNLDFAKFLNTIRPNANSYIYFDPPYLISGSEYNKFWNEKEEQRLCDCLDKLNEKGIRFGITNLIRHKGKTNTVFCEWSKKYTVYQINSNYISFNDNTLKATSKEVFVTNYVMQ